MISEANDQLLLVQMSNLCDESLQVKNIDLSNLDPSHPGGERWEVVRAAVADALITDGYFEAIYSPLSEDVQHAFFDRALPELFALPLEAKHRNKKLNNQGYVGQIPNMAYESTRFEPSVDGVEDFTRMMWPHGNPNFCKAVAEFTRPLQDVIEIVHRMILENLGVEKYYDAHMSSLSYGLRLGEYGGVPMDEKAEVFFPAHFDSNLVSIICQYMVQGLEIETPKRDWINVGPSHNSFSVIIGQALQAWTNGKLRATKHRVRIPEDKRRYSSIYSSEPNYNAMVETPVEMVDEKHPLLYKPYNYTEYLNFRFQEGHKHKDVFTAYCGIDQEATS